MDNYQIAPAENGCRVRGGCPQTRTISSQKPVHAIADRLLDWHDQAKLAGRVSRANMLLDLAWYAFCVPAKAITVPDRETIREFGSSLPVEVRWLDTLTAGFVADQLNPTNCGTPD